MNQQHQQHQQQHQLQQQQRRVGGGGPPPQGHIHPHTPHMQQGQGSQVLQGKLKKYELQRPDKKDLGLGLGPPDFYPLDASSKEDTLSQEYILGGFCERYSHEESRSSSGSFRNVDSSKIKEQLLQSIYEIEWKKSASKESTKNAMGRERMVGTKKAIPELKAWSTNHREGWVMKLAGTAEPLHRLALNVPHGYKGETLLKMFLDNQVPLIRATWYTKIVYGNLKNKMTEPSGDWTKILVQSLFAFIRNNSPSADQTNAAKRLSNYTGLLYIERLLRWNFSEGLLNKDILLTMLIDHLNESERPDESVIVADLLLYYSDTLIHSTYLSNRFLIKSFDKIQKILGSAATVNNQNLISPSNQKILSILYIVLKQISITLPDIFMSFNRFKELIQLIYPQQTSVKSEITSSGTTNTKNNISFTISPEEKWEKYYQTSLEAQPSSSSPPVVQLKKNFLDYSDLIKSFDRFLLNLDLKQLYKEIFQNQISLEEDREKILLICEWACTPCRNHPYTFLSASSLLQMYEKNLIIKNNFDGNPFIKNPLQNILIYFLENFKNRSEIESLKKICYFYSELIRNEVFSENSYARYIISRGILENQIEQKDSTSSLMNHRYFLGEFPIYNTNDYPTNDIQKQRNQRRTILYANSYNSQDESKNMEVVREAIKKFILSETESTDESLKEDQENLLTVIGLLTSLPYYSQSSLTEWLSLCMRVHFKSSFSISTDSTNLTIDSLTRGSRYFTYPLTPRHLDRCFRLMESVNNLFSITQCLMVFWENWKALTLPLKSYVYYSTCKFEPSFITSNRITTLLDIFYHHIHGSDKNSSSSDSDSDSESMDSDEEMIETNDIGFDNYFENYFNSLLEKYKSIKIISSWISKRNLQVKIKPELSNLNQSLTIIANDSKISGIINQNLIDNNSAKLIEDLEIVYNNQNNLTKQDFSTMVIAAFINNYQNLEIQLSTSSRFLIDYCFSITPFEMNNQELFCIILKEIISNRIIDFINNNDSQESRDQIIQRIRIFIRLMIFNQFIDPYEILNHSFLPLFQNHTNLVFLEILFQFLSSLILEDFKYYNISKIKSLSLLFPVLCKLYNQSNQANVESILKNQIKNLLSQEKDFKYIFFNLESEKQIELLKLSNLSTSTIRYLYYLILEESSPIGFYKYEPIQSDNIFQYSFDLVNQSLSKSLSNYWNIQLTYLELLLLLEEWQTNITLEELNPKSMITQFILNHFEKNRGWEKLFLYQNLFLNLPQSIRDEFIKLTTRIMESQYQQECFEPPNDKLYLFSHMILINLPDSQNPSSTTSSTSFSNEDIQLIQDSFTEFTIHILSTFEESSPLLSTLVLSIQKQLNLLLENTLYYESINIPQDLIDNILSSLSMRISFLVPLVNTIKSCKVECKLEDLSITLLSLLGRFIIQSDEEYQFFDCILSILDILLSDKNEKDPNQNQDYKFQVKRKLYDHYQSVRNENFSYSFQQKIEKQLSFLINSTISTPFSIIQPPTVNTILNNQNYITSKEIIPSEIKPVITQMDPWSLLEDYIETPLSPSVFGGIKMERKDLSYIRSSFPTKNMVIIPNPENPDPDTDNNSPINIIKQQYLQNQSIHKTNPINHNMKNQMLTTPGAPIIPLNKKPPQGIINNQVQVPQQAIPPMIHQQIPPQQQINLQQQVPIQYQQPNITQPPNLIPNQNLNPQPNNFTNQSYQVVSNKQSNKKTRA